MRNWFFKLAAILDARVPHRDGETRGRSIIAWRNRFRRELILKVYVNQKYTA